MARQSPGRRNAEDPEVEDELGDLDVLDDDAEADVEDDDDLARSSETETLWAELRIDPIEISLPTGTGFTLRAYRRAEELTPTQIEATDEEDLFAASHRRTGRDEDLEDEDLDELERRERDEDDNALDDDALDEDEDEDEDEAVEAAEEEVPVFLGHRGRLYVFRTPESLVEFVRSGEENDMAQLDTWGDLVEKVRTEDVVAALEDRYELDLVVENLRGGHDTWDSVLVISAGEIARDIAYAFRVEPILAGLASGSPLDDLDEALRATVAGGLSGFMGRRRLKKIGAQQATLGWRTMIGKISGVVVWRD